MTPLQQQGALCKAAGRTLATAGTTRKNEALSAIAEILSERQDEWLAANAADVAAATGRTEMAVRAARSRRGICRTRWTADELGRLRDYAASPKQIAAETGHSL